jgi:hypothetical protein
MQTEYTGMSSGRNMLCLKTPTKLVQGNMMDDSAYNRGSFRADWLLNLVTTESKFFVKINPDMWFFPADISICECEGEMTGRNI